ncbi:hypothetical protein OS493_032811 [Desmophyllum pertusum]|uniref:Uncharacterized protein n=1 Tax=Desmophyllum pertusum TaxID=174260 RepID=A0A9X0CUR2_9CNID|nr:hypothetical protein OS493_032811 [Desmophyllum pertusum]
MSSSGYESSPTGSLSSLASDVFNNEERPPNVIKKSATLPRFETIEDVVVQSQPSPVIPRSRSVTSMAHYKKEMELSVNGISSTGRISNSGRNSPIPAPRKNSASNRRSPLAGSPPRGRESDSAPPRKLSGSVSPRKLSGSVSPRLSPRANSEIENEANSRLYRAMHTYISQEDGEVTFIEG